MTIFLIHRCDRSGLIPVGWYAYHYFCNAKQKWDFQLNLWMRYFRNESEYGKVTSREKLEMSVLPRVGFENNFFCVGSIISLEGFVHWIAQDYAVRKSSSKKIGAANHQNWLVWTRPHVNKWSGMCEKIFWKFVLVDSREKDREVGKKSQPANLLWMLPCPSLYVWRLPPESNLT